MIVSTTWSIARDLGNMRGSSISDIMPKKDTWAMKAKTMLVTARKASAKLGDVVISFWTSPGAWTPMSIMVTMVAVRILMADMVDIQNTLPDVRGRAPMKLTIKPTTPKTMVQVPWLVIVLNNTEKVRMWLAIKKIRNSSWPK